MVEQWLKASAQQLYQEKQVGWATPELTPVDKKEPTPLVEAGSRPSRNHF